MKFVVSHGKPSVSEYNELRVLNEWPVLKEELVVTGLSNTLFSVVVHDEGGSIIGMGRVVGDGAVYLHIQDVIVRPAHHGMGIGKAIMHEIMKYLDTAGGEHTNIGLMCSKGREGFYEKFGFITRPNTRFGAGMIKIKQ